MRQFVEFEFYKIIIHQNQTSVKILLQKVAKFKTHNNSVENQKDKIKLLEQKSQFTILILIEI